MSTEATSSRASALSLVVVTTAGSLTRSTATEAVASGRRIVERGSALGAEAGLSVLTEAGLTLTSQRRIALVLATELST
ncbi:MAG: hypothetical protein INR71_14830 [Terriglobus roseus]|nr:hypothetical protein [Terriglobus roseus]